MHGNKKRWSIICIPYVFQQLLLESETKIDLSIITVYHVIFIPINCNHIHNWNLRRIYWWLSVNVHVHELYKIQDIWICE